MFLIPQNAARVLERRVHNTAVKCCGGAFGAGLCCRTPLPAGLQDVVERVHPIKMLRNRLNSYTPLTFQSKCPVAVLPGNFCIRSRKVLPAATSAGQFGAAKPATFVAGISVAQQRAV